MTIDERDVAQARAHPRGNERRTLLPYREALNHTAVYARLSAADRDVIVRWTEVRRRLAESGLDHDDADLADPLLPYAALRAHVIEGERAAAGGIAFTDPGGDLRDAVALIRASR